jgi:hypothetical protein
LLIRGSYILSSSIPKPRRRWSLLALLAALHLLGLLAMIQAVRKQPAAQPRSIELSLIAEQPRPQPPSPPRRETAAHAPTLPAVEQPSTVAAPTVAAALPATLPSPPASAASAPPLRLDLPAMMKGQPSARDLAMRDPRSHTPRATLESHMADALGVLPAEVQDSTDGTGSKLIRQGSKCTRVTPSRIGTLNPMDPRAASLPAVTGACFR